MYPKCVDDCAVASPSKLKRWAGRGAVGGAGGLASSLPLTAKAAWSVDECVVSSSSKPRRSAGERAAGGAGGAVAAGSRGPAAALGSAAVLG